jgi:hypothetical protein
MLVVLVAVVLMAVWQALAVVALVELAALAEAQVLPILVVAAVPLGLALLHLVLEAQAL